jgi:hypothetical protein
MSIPKVVFAQTLDELVQGACHEFKRIQEPQFSFNLLFLTILTPELINLYFFGKGDVLLLRFRDVKNIQNQSNATNQNLDNDRPMAINIESEDPNDNSNDDRSEITFAAVVKQKANHTEESNTKRSGSENNGNSIEHGLTNQNQWEVNNNQQIVLEDNTNSEFVGVARRVVKRLYLGGAREGATSELVTEYMERKGISPTVIRIFKSKRKGTVAIRVNKC